MYSMENRVQLKLRFEKLVPDVPQEHLVRVCVGVQILPHNAICILWN